MLKHLVTFTTATLLLLAGLTIAGCVSSSPGVPPQAGPVVLAGQVESYPLGRHLDLLADPTGQLTLADVAGPAYAAAFSPSQADVPNLGTSREPAAVWVRFRVRNNTAQAAWMLALHEGRTGVLDLYYPDPGGGAHFVHKQTGTRFPMSSRDVNYHRFSLTCPCRRGRSRPFICGCRTTFRCRCR